MGENEGKYTHFAPKMHPISGQGFNGDYKEIELAPLPHVRCSSGNTHRICASQCSEIVVMVDRACPVVLGFGSFNHKPIVYFEIAVQAFRQD